MELTIEEFRQEIGRLDHKIEQEIASLKEAITVAQARTTQWVAVLFISMMIIMATLTGVYIKAILLMR